jgi:hypothetical protein
MRSDPYGFQHNLSLLFSDKDFQPFTEHPDLCNAVYKTQVLFRFLPVKNPGISLQPFIPGGSAGPNMLKKPEPVKTSALNHGTLPAKNIVEHKGRFKECMGTQSHSFLGG